MTPLLLLLPQLVLFVIHLLIYRSISKKREPRQLHFYIFAFEYVHFMFTLCDLVWQ